ncbi:type II toxin-antitoxin system RelE/ParE family toxin [Fulvivirga sp. M361]|uniref:type II toxin-antitoxin system RelE/ParE family toxin n=1 Tax=Fulvivirga sp. M361 TaxID=2594266 RepID=UPI00117A9035|nr:type II toxin-antitoxin system RelE/ParE family toxin [Fulvivirga sp. M361]
MSYKISSKARLDLISIWEFTKENWSTQQADRYYQIIVDKFIEISSHPDLGKNYDDLRTGYRGIIVKSHIIFYRISPQNSIEIIRILHQRMDYKTRLAD